MNRPTLPLRTVADTEGDKMLGRWAQDMRAANKSPRTITERINLVTRCARIAQVEPQLMTSEHASAFLSGSPNKARATYYAHLHSWFLWLVRIEFREDVPTLKLDRPKARRRDPSTISTGHVRSLAQSSIWGRTRTMVLLGAYQGLRASEIAVVRGSDVDLVGDLLTVTGKGDVTRILPLHPLVKAEAARYTRGWWFPSGAHPGQPMLAASVSQVISDAMTRLHIPGTCHDLRRWYATTMIEGGYSTVYVQRLLGHASVATTERYVSVDRRQLVDAVMSLPDVTQPLSA